MPGTLRPLVSVVPLVPWLQSSAGAGIASGGGSTTADADWLARSTAAGVVLATDFSGPNDFSTQHIFANNLTPSLLARVVKRLGDGITGGCCLEIQWPAGSSDGSPAWVSSLNPALFTTKTSGIGTNPYWIQFRVKYPASRLARSVDHGGGFKLCIVGGFDASNWSASSSDINNEFVVQNTLYRGFPAAYVHTMSPTTGGWDGNYNSFETAFVSQYSNTDFKTQNAIDRGAGFDDAHRYCLYSQGNGASPPAPLNVGAYPFVADEWLTVMMRVHYATYGVGSGAGNEIDVWCARPGATSWTQIVTGRGFPVPTDSGYSGGPNGIWLLTYDTNGGPYTADTYARYDQLIVSTQVIALPNDTPLQGTTQADGSLLVNFAATTAWWNSLPLNQVVEVANTKADALQLQFPPGFTDFGSVKFPSIMAAWSGAAWDPVNGRLYCAGGGHSDGSDNGLAQFDLESMTWSWAMVPSVFTLATAQAAQAAWGAAWNSWSQGIDSNGNAADTWPDGKPTALHCYNDLTWTGSVVIRGGLKTMWHYSGGAATPGAAIGYISDVNSLWDPVNQVIIRCKSLANDYWDIRTYDPVTRTHTIRPHLNLAPSTKYQWDQDINDPLQRWIGNIDFVGREFVACDGGRAWAINADTWVQRAIAIPNPTNEKTLRCAASTSRGYEFLGVSGNLYILNASTGAISQPATVGTFAPAGTTPNGVFGRFRRYLRGSVELLVMIPATSENVRLVRVA